MSLITRIEENQVKLEAKIKDGVVVFRDKKFPLPFKFVADYNSILIGAPSFEEDGSPRFKKHQDGGLWHNGITGAPELIVTKVRLKSKSNRSAPKTKCLCEYTANIMTPIHIINELCVRYFDPASPITDLQGISKKRTPAKYNAMLEQSENIEQYKKTQATLEQKVAELEAKLAIVVPEEDPKPFTKSVNGKKKA